MMSDKVELNEKILHTEEIEPKTMNGMGILVLNIVLMIAALAAIIFGLKSISSGIVLTAGSVAGIIAASIYLCIIGPILFAGLKILKPNEALVLTLFGKYHGSLKGEGFYFVNPFVVGFNPSADTKPSTGGVEQSSTAGRYPLLAAGVKKPSKVISLKTMTLNNDIQKINDELGNPIIIGIVVIWRVVNTAKAVFCVDNYIEYLSIQCDSSLRNIVRLYPYDASSDDGEKSLRGSSQEVADKIKEEIQSRVEAAGLEILEARITHLAYAPEIAAAMLQRQQASAIIAARQMIVEGAVGMVEMALDKLNENNVVQLDEERKAAMVSNLLVVLCGNRDAQPIINSGSLY